MRKNYLVILLFCFVCDLNSFAQLNNDTTITVYFKTDSFNLETLQSQNLNNFFSSFPEIKQIIGYTDSTGERDYNFSLSKKRAFSVFRLLQTYIDSAKEDLLIFRGESTTLPELWMNRRMQIIARSDNNRIVVQKADNHTSDTVRRHLSPDSPKLNADISSDTVSSFYLENVYFVPDKPIVTSESLPSIQKLAGILKNHSKEKIDIIGHINYQSRFDSTHLGDLFKLSEQRAKTVYDYLIEFGVSKERMSFKGVEIRSLHIPSL